MSLAVCVVTLLATLPLACSSTSASPDGGAPLPDRGPGREAAAPDARRDAPAPDAFVPFALELTVNRVPLPMNGSTTFTNLAGKQEAFRLTVPRHGFALDVSWRGSRARPETLQVSCDTPLGALAPGADLAARFVRQGETARLLVPSELALPVGSATCSAQLSDGAATRQAQLTVDVAERTFLLDPFRLEDRWLLVFSQDNYTITRGVDGSGALLLTSVAQPNGIADFDEDLRAVGLGTAQPRPDAAALQRFGVSGTNAVLRVWIQRRILAAVRRAFLIAEDGTTTAESVRIRFLLEGEPGAPQLSDYKPQVLQGGETQRSFSAIAIGGADLSRAYLGLSKTIDLRNVRNEDNLGPEYGVFTTKAIATIVQLLNTDPAVKLVFRALFGDLLPELGQGGKPVGEHELDAVILAAGFDPAQGPPGAATRLQKLTFLVDTLGQLAGALVAHEISHALGLVADGPPPYGLFGGEKNATFVNGARTTSAHIDTAGFNLEEAGPGSAPGVPLNPLQYLTEPHFNELDLAYLQGRVLLLPRP